MNYIRELNAFRDWVLLNPLATGQVALWHSLMSINNMTGWSEWFTTPNQTLQLMTGLSRQGLDKARLQLSQKNLIQYKKGKSNQAGSYKIISLCNFECMKVGTEMVTGGALEESQEERESSTLFKHKQNETKQDIKPPVSPKGEEIITESKIKFADYVSMTQTEYDKLTELLGEEERDDYFLSFASWISGQTPRVQKNRSAYHTVLEWHRRDQKNPKRSGNQSKYERSKSKLDQLYEEAIASGKG